jgi:hypothetical protein
MARAALSPSSSRCAAVVFGLAQPARRRCYAPCGALCSTVVVLTTLRSCDDLPERMGLDVVFLMSSAPSAAADAADAGAQGSSSVSR